ncbi:T9SS type A sorting domain-containing protein [Flavobacterium hauense]
MKKISLLFFMLFYCMTYSQIKVDTIWKSQINAIFENIDKSRVPTGVLLDYAMEFTNVAAYNGTITDSTEVSATILGNIYKTLLMGKVTSDTINFPTFKNVAKKWAYTRHESNPDDKNVIILSGLLYEYAKLDPDAYQDGKIDVINDKYYDKYVDGILQNPYITSKTFAVAAPVKKINGLEINVKLPENLFLSNMERKDIKMEANFNDGKGYQQIQFDQLLTVVYTEPGTKTWTLKFTKGAEIFESNLTMNVFDGITPPTKNFSLQGAKIRIDYAPSHNNQLIKPLIVAEGFDPGSILTPEIAGGDRSLNTFKNSLINSGDLTALLDGVNQQYDIVYIDWKNGVDDIKKNSKVLRDIIIWVNQQKVLFGSVHKNVLLGQSMGGLIGRYTLAKMEEDDELHDVRLFIAHDSPMQGANTPLSIQYLSRHMYNEYVGAPILYGAVENIIPGILSYIDFMLLGSLNIAFPSIEDALTLADTPAALQMNYQYVDINGNPTLAPHVIWQTEFDAMGYPEDSRNIAISNGNECAPDNGFNAGDDLINIDDDHNPGFWGDLLHMLITPTIGVLANDFTLSLLGLIPGSSKYFFDFDVRSNPDFDNQNRLVYHGKIQYRKKFLWFGPNITHTLTEDNGWAPNEPGYHPFDTYSGGINDIGEIIEDYQQYLPSNTLVNPVYGFIPVVSSLDIHRNKTQVMQNDYRLHYSGAGLPDPNLHSGFDAFIVGFNEFDVTFQQNFSHISFQARNGNWLANELNDNNDNTILNCAYICDSEIKGPEEFCSTSTYLAGAGANSYLWTIVNGTSIAAIPPGKNTGRSVSVVAMGTGWITLRVNYTGNCGTRVVTRQIYIGTALPILGPVSCADHSSAADECTAFASMPLNVPVPLFVTGPGMEGASSYDHEWVKVSGDFIFVPSSYPQHSDAQNMGTKAYGKYGVIFRNGNGTEIVFKARIKNGCGWGPWKTFHVFNTQSNFMMVNEESSLSDQKQYIYYIYPNPANDILNITLLDENLKPQDEAIISGELYDLSNVLLRTISITSPTATMNVQGIAPGIYILRINVNGTIESHQVAIH